MDDSVDAAPQLLQLTGNQQALYGALQVKATILATIYHGALSVLQDGGNPDRLALAAHGLRELMEKIPRYLDLPREEPSSNMTVQVRALQETWRDTVEKTICLSDRCWNGPIDTFLERFLQRVRDFFLWVDSARPPRRQAVTAALRKLDPLPHPLPEPIEKLRVKEWEFIHNYFEKVSHHNGTVTFDEFSRWLANLEKFLLDNLIPRTFEDHARIDEIIDEGDNDAEA
jgi:hypothetical protein